MIPKVIHQIWIGNEGQLMPEILKELSVSWQLNNPECQFILWDKEKLNDLLIRFFPEMQSLMASYTYDIQRIDVYKCLLLYKFGGLYVDLDCECIQPIFQLFADSDCVLSQNSENEKFFIGNFFMASIANSHFIKFLIDGLSNDSELRKNGLSKLDIVLQSTGPLYVSDKYHEYVDTNKNVEKSIILVLDYSCVAPLTAIESRKMMESGFVEDISAQKLNIAYAVHYFFGMWT